MRSTVHPLTYIRTLSFRKSPLRPSARIVLWLLSVALLFSTVACTTDHTDPPTSVTESPTVSLTDTLAATDADTNSSVDTEPNSESVTNPETRPAEETSPSEETVPSEDTAPSEDTSPNEETTTSEETTPIEETTSAEELPPETTAPPEPDPEPTPAATIQNIIFLIADGGGYDNFQLADETKQALFARGMNRLGANARTPLTNSRLAAYGYDNGTGLYLNQFLVGSSNTLLARAHAQSYITDSSAAATALATGYKTTYCYAGIDSDRHPRATLAELAQMNGMATGVVSTKSFVDATPLAFFTAHAIHRYEYQDTSLQAILSGVDVVLAEGTEYGDIPVDGRESSHLGAGDAGYTVVRNNTELQAAVADREISKLWGSFMGRKNTTLSYATDDLAADHISYDIDPTLRDEPTLLDMTAAALQFLQNKNDPDGFFLMIEGGALDNAAELGCLRYAVGEALAFDEAFAYCVEWAKQNGDNTLVIATADHDSGGFYGIENQKDALIDAIISGQFPDGTPIAIKHTFSHYKSALNMDDTAGIVSGHSDMPVPIWLYAPDTVRDAVIADLGIPSDTSPDQIRHADKGQYYDLEAINEAYLIENTAIAPVLANLISDTTLDEATAHLYVPVATRYGDGSIAYHSGLNDGQLVFGESDTRKIGPSIVTYFPVTFTFGTYQFTRNSAAYQKDGQSYTFNPLGDHQPMALFITTAPAGEPGVQTGTFYLPKSVVEEMLNAQHSP